MYDVFISCKSADYQKAEPVYHWLKSMGHKPFFAPISLKGNSVFGDEVDAALEEADNMIVFTSKPEYVKAGYVKDEWRTFVEEQRAGRKSGSLITILDGVRVEDLPIRLRSVQSFTPSNYKEGILRFLGEAPQTSKTQRARSQEEASSQERRFEVGGVEFKMIRVEGGSFMMGAPNKDPDAFDNEKPQHEVTLSDYYIGETPVTQALWNAVMGENPSHFEGGNSPVEEVSWTDCQEFIKKLNTKTGRTFRLPTEAEWEFAARGGNKSRGYKYAGDDNIDEVAWYGDNSERKTHPVKQKKANELDLYDMSGNVWEWCQDWFDRYGSGKETKPTGPSGGSDRVLRGGGWIDDAQDCRVASRYYGGPGNRGSFIGFRLALVQP